MSTRGENREWLIRESTRCPDGWEARMIRALGMEGALDLLAIEGADVINVDFRRSPFRRDGELKFLVSEANAAVAAAMRRAYEFGYEVMR